MIKEWCIFYATRITETNTAYHGKFIIDDEAKARKALLRDDHSVKFEVVVPTNIETKPVGLALAHYVHDLTDEWPLLVFVVPPGPDDTKPWAQACKLPAENAHHVVPDLIVFVTNVPGIQTTRKCTIVEKIGRDQMIDVLEHTERPEGPLLAMPRVAPTA